MFHLKALIIIIIIIIIIINNNNNDNNIFIYNEDNVHFFMTAILTYSPPMTTDDSYYRTIFSDLFASDKMYRRREAIACPISLSTKQDSRWYHFNACGMTRVSNP